MKSTPDSIAARLIARIAAEGPITVADYMEICTTHYYATRDPFGAQGDFTTAPEISQIFGELLGAWVVECWKCYRTPAALLCELGPGRGTLMKDLLRATRNVPEFHPALQIRMVETSPVLRGIQQKTLAAAHASICWQESLENLPPLPLFLIANEFFDALPIQQFVRSGNSEAERKVTCNNGAFAFAPAHGIIREASPVSLHMMQKIAAHIRAYGGAALIIDYGYTGGSQADTLQALSKHRYSDPLLAPGEADITAHVDFSALEMVARKQGVMVTDAIGQGLFLKRLGAELRAMALCKAADAYQRETILAGLTRLIAPDQMGELFKVMAVTSQLDKPAGF